MTIFASDLYQHQLEGFLEILSQDNVDTALNFKLYLDTVIINLPTKIQKYKKSIYFDDENIKDIEHKGLVIPFLIDEKNENYVILGIVEKEVHSHE